MNVYHFLITVLAGIAGTICMTFVMYLYTWVFRKRRRMTTPSHQQVDTRVIHIFGTMAAGVSDSAQKDFKTCITGTMGHFGAGLGFAFAYFLLWNWGVFDVAMDDAIILGGISGIMAIAVWNGYFYLHHDPPNISLVHYSLALFLAHIIFGIVTVYMFTLIIDNPEFYYQLMKNKE